MFYAQFLELCNKEGVKPTPLIKSLGLSPGNLKRWENGSTVNSDILLMLSEHFGVSVDYLLTGKEYALKSSLTDDEQILLSYYNCLDENGKHFVLGGTKELAELRKSVENVDSQNALKPLKNGAKETVKIDLFTLPVSAGFGVYLDSEDKEEIEVERTSVTEEADFALCVSGNSMEPEYYDGDILLIRSQPTIQLGEVGIFVLNGKGYVKKLGRNRLISLNDEYQDIVFSENDLIWCMGKVLGTTVKV